MKLLRIVSLLMLFAISVSLCSCDYLDGFSVLSLFNMEESVNGIRIPGTDFNLYDDMCGKIEKNERAFIYLNIEEDDIADTYFKIVREHPEYFWLISGYSYKKLTTGNSHTVEFTPVLIGSDAEIQKKREKFEPFIRSLQESIDAQSAPYDKILWIHDYIVDTTAYDKEAAASADTANDASTAYGCLINGRAICSGYSAAFQLLLQMSGITCGTVSGAKVGGESHAWNYVLLDGDYYYVDVTWDDPLSDSTSDNKIYEYFMITTDELIRTHTIDSNQFVPQCTATKYDFYVYNGLYLEKYDFDAISALFAEHGSDGEISIKFSSDKERQAAVNDLIGNDKFFSIPTVTANSVRYSNDEASQVLMLWYE